METELHNPQGEHPAPKKKRARRVKPRAKAAAKPAEAKLAPFAGISQSDCCLACDPDKCEITGMNVCGHPYKGGLQAALQNNPDVVRRYQAARRVLAHQVTDKKI